MRQQLSIQRYFPQFGGNLGRTGEKTAVDQAGPGCELPTCDQDGRRYPTEGVVNPKNAPFRMFCQRQRRVLFRKSSAEVVRPLFGRSAHFYLSTTLPGKNSGSIRSATTRSMSVPGSMT